MVEKKYRICLIVPLGNRKGEMVLREDSGLVEGWLDLMNEKNTFSGELSADGQLIFSGTLRTLVNTLHYMATGIISGRNIILNIKTDTGACYPLTGEEYLTDEQTI